jgi:RNA polymerase sigma factor (sigma-70 family)
MVESLLPKGQRRLTRDEEINLRSLAQDGDALAREQLILAAIPQAIAIVEQQQGLKQIRGLDHDERESIAQLAAVEAVDAYDPRAGSLGSILTLYIKGHLRSLRRRNAVADTFSDLSPIDAESFLGTSTPSSGENSDNAVFPLNHTGLRRAYTELPPRFQEVLRLRYLEGCTTGQIADRLFLSGHHVRRLEAEALRILREQLTTSTAEDDGPADAA